MAEQFKTAQYVMRETASGSAMSGFNCRVLGDGFADTMRHRQGSDYAEAAAGWNLADRMISEGKLFFVHNFHTQGRCCAFPYGGTWVCNSCGQSRLNKEWWKIRVYKDGNAWCCIGTGFEDLQESDNYAFGDSREEAIESYRILMESRATQPADAGEL